MFYAPNAIAFFAISCLRRLLSKRWILKFLGGVKINGIILNGFAVLL
jgi:hypothetical protein